MKYFRSSLAIASSFSIALFYHKSLPFYDSLCKESNKDIQGGKQEFEDFLLNFQNNFVSMIQSFETKNKFLFDKWERADNSGYGLSCVLQDGNFFEKAGINTTKITLPFSQPIARHMRERGKNYSDEEIKNYLVYANGVSLVIHPVNPFIPTVHANYRYFEIQNKNTGEVVDYWFGGGADLTPHYLNEEDALIFHSSHKKACDLYDKNLYFKLKKNCDDYFYIPFRKEHRGIGGIFYDDFIINDDWKTTLDFSKNCAFSLLYAYNEILEKRKNKEYNDKNLRWKEIRRGRYAEFNLVIDRGTKFGLATPDSRIESILMSLPLVCRWEYQFKIDPNSEEEKMMNILKNPKDWIPEFQSNQ